MKGVQAFDDLQGLERSLKQQIKNLKKDIHALYNPVYIVIIKRRLRILNSILKASRYSDFSHKDLLYMVDIELNKSKKELEVLE